MSLLQYCNVLSYISQLVQALFLRFVFSLLVAVYANTP